MKKVDDAMGIIYTHGIAGFFGGLLLGIFADPSVVVYQSVGGSQVALKGRYTATRGCCSSSSWRP